MTSRPWDLVYCHIGWSYRHDAAMTHAHRAARISGRRYRVFPDTIRGGWNWWPVEAGATDNAMTNQREGATL